MKPMKAADERSTRVLARPDDGAHARVTTSYVLFVVDGPDAGLHFEFDGARPARVLVGQSPACELRLTDPHVSRRHAALDATPRGLRLTDLDSKNGTTANGVPIAAAYLQGGETIVVGRTTLRLEVSPLDAPLALSDATRFGRLLGASPEMRRLYPLCERLAASDLPITIEGETGTGKEVLAEALHEASARADGPFVVCDCTAIPANLAESTLFGHVRGSFTGATSARKSIFEEAHGGTLLIDEIGELDLALQPKLLRAIERAEIQNVGSNQWTKVDVRVIAATRRDLDREVQAGRFRDDLFFRLAVGRIELPPLRQRTGDIGVLARHFWRSLGGAGEIPAEAVARFEDYAWPGNVRELHNAVARLLALGDLSVAPSSPASKAPAASASPSAASSLPDDAIEHVLAQDLPLVRARQLVVEDFEQRYVKRVLLRYDGNVVRAAAASGIARRYFQILRARHAKDDAK
jgi:DNA-binding NtrC family response regulator